MTKKQAPIAERTEPGGLTRNIRDFAEYLELARLELRKVTWASAKETRVTSAAVLVFVVIMAIFLGLVDWGLSRLIGLALR
jgi:preprotein translocase subunit SecE